MTDRSQAADLEAQVASLRRELDRLMIIVYGDQTMHVKGLASRVEHTEDLREEFEGWKKYLRGLAVGLGITAIGSGASIVTVIKGLLGV